MLAKGILAIGLAFSVSQSNAMELVKDPSTPGILTLRDGTTNVLSYCYGEQLPKGIDPKYARSSYIHPLYSLDGQPLTEDFPADHPHHHGVFWAWPVVKVRGVTTQNWHPHDPSLRHKFVRWIKQTTGTENAVIAVENQWLLNDKEEVARERVTIQVSPIVQNSRAIDIEIELEAIGGPLTLQGTSEGNKGYGGFCFRAAPAFKGASINTDTGPRDKDIVDEPHKWVDLSTGKYGLTIFAAPDHPDFPPSWMARNSYAGFMNASWPGLDTKVLNPGEPVTLRYRLYVHRGAAQPATIQDAYEKYTGMEKPVSAAN